MQRRRRPLYRERQNLISIASITLSIGADNVGVYIVFFNINRTNLWQIIAIELVLLARWCAGFLVYVVLVIQDFFSFD